MHMSIDRLSVFLSSMRILHFLHGSPKKIVLSDLFFLEGALFFGIGWVIAAGLTIFRMERWQTLYASPDGHAEYLRSERGKQVLFGLAFIVLGTILIGLSVGISVLPT